MEDLKHLKLQVYSADWCPDCRRLEQWLESVGAIYEKVDIEKMAGAAESWRQKPAKERSLLF